MYYIDNKDDQSESKKRPENYLKLGIYCIPSNQHQSSDTHNKVDVVLSGQCHPSSMDKAAELAKSYKTSGESDRPDKYTEACGRENMQFQQLWRSEEHTSELQSRGHLVCRLLLEKK